MTQESLKIDELNYIDFKFLYVFDPHNFSNIFCKTLLHRSYFRSLNLSQILSSDANCVSWAPVDEVSSRVYLFAYCLNPYKTMNFTRFCLAAMRHINWVDETGHMWI